MFNLAAAIIIACGVADNEKTLTCWDVYNNCALNAAFKRGEEKATQKDFDTCKATYGTEEKRIKKLQEEK